MGSEFVFCLRQIKLKLPISFGIAVGERCENFIGIYVEIAARTKSTSLLLMEILRPIYDNWLELIFFKLADGCVRVLNLC